MENCNGSEQTFFLLLYIFPRLKCLLTLHSEAGYANTYLTFDKHLQSIYILSSYALWLVLIADNVLLKWHYK